METTIHSLYYTKIENDEFKLSNSKFRININFNKILNNQKEKISNDIMKWDKIKKITNPYEYVTTPFEISSINFKKEIVKLSKKNPLSRAYYKMIEIIYFFDLFYDYGIEGINTFHLAEGPGGFIEAFVDIRDNKSDKYYGMSLENNSDKNFKNNIPGWKKASNFLKKNENVSINPFKNGDLFDKDNLDIIMDKKNNFFHNFDIITGDGGFDFSVDFNKQEESALKLIYTQMVYGMCLQKNGGILVLKVFDLFTRGSIELIYLLSLYYEEVNIFKPKTSRYANSEKYIICLNFNAEKFDKNSEKIIELYKKMMMDEENKYNSFLDIELNYEFMKNIKRSNVKFISQQIKTINDTFELIQNKYFKNKISQMKTNNIIECKKWFIEHDIEYNDV